ncbi:MAG: hypothetical protein V4443_11375 [Pseudomonadota bacterium]
MAKPPDAGIGFKHLLQTVQFGKYITGKKKTVHYLTLHNDQTASRLPARKNNMSIKKIISIADITLT